MNGRLRRSDRLVLGVLVVVALICFALWSVSRNTTSGAPPQATSSPTSSPTATATATKQPSDLEQAVYRFESVYALPPSSRRTEQLKAMTTPDGFAALNTETTGTSHAEQAAGAVTAQVETNLSSVQSEAFDDPNVVSVSSTVVINTFRNGQKLNTVPVMRIASWVKQNGQWKLAAVQPSATST